MMIGPTPMLRIDLCERRRGEQPYSRRPALVALGIGRLNSPGQHTGEISDRPPKDWMVLLHSQLDAARHGRLGRSIAPVKDTIPAVKPTPAPIRLLLARQLGHPAAAQRRCASR